MYSFSSPDTAIISLLAVYVGGMYGGSISAITLNTPGNELGYCHHLGDDTRWRKGKSLDTSCLHRPSAVFFRPASSGLCFLYYKTCFQICSVEYSSMAILGISLIAEKCGDSLRRNQVYSLRILMAAIGADAVVGVMRLRLALISALRN